MAKCATCTKLRPITEPEASCRPTKSQVTEVRITCDEQITETYAPSTAGDCTVGFIDDIVSVDPVGDPTPIINVPIFNEEDFDETNTFTYDREAEVGEDTWSIQMGIRVYTDDHQCTMDSLKGQEISVLYKIEGRAGDFVWRRIKGLVSAVEGGLLDGYLVTVDIIDPVDSDKPLFVNFGTADATTTALDALTVFA